MCLCMLQERVGGGHQHSLGPITSIGGVGGTAAVSTFAAAPRIHTPTTDFQPPYFPPPYLATENQMPVSICIKKFLFQYFVLSINAQCLMTIMFVLILCYMNKDNSLCKWLSYRPIDQIGVLPIEFKNNGRLQTIKSLRILRSTFHYLFLIYLHIKLFFFINTLWICLVSSKPLLNNCIISYSQSLSLMLHQYL